MSRAVQQGCSGPPATCTLPVLRDPDEIYDGCCEAVCAQTVESPGYVLVVTNPDTGPPASFFDNIRITEDGQMRIIELNEPRLVE